MNSKNNAPISVFSASLKLVRSASKISYEIGVNREITFSLHETGTRLVLTRYFSEEEMENKRREARKKGNSCAFIPPFVSQVIDKRAAKVLFENRETILSSLLKLSTGLPLDTTDSFIRLGDAKSNLYLSMDADSSCVHIRSYWWSKAEDCLKPHKRGITITVDEFANAMCHLDTLYPELEE